MMRRWRKGKDDDEEVLTFDDLEDGEGDDEEEEDEKERPRHRYIPPRQIRTRFEYGSDDVDDGPTFEELEGKIRAGKYKPKQEDPWNAHVLYQTLKDLGDI